MSDRALPPKPTPLDSTRVGRTDLGAGTALVDDEALTIVIPRAAPDERPLRVRLAAIDDLRVAGAEITLTLADGTHLTFVTSAAEALYAELAARCHAVPELARALRALGSRRGRSRSRASAPDEQQRFFAPLLAARRAAASANDPRAALAAFDGRALSARLDQAMTELAAARCAEAGPERRALEAELGDAAEPLGAALRALTAAADDAAAAPDDLRRWRAWTAQLGAAFETADRVWLALDAALDATAWTA